MKPKLDEEVYGTLAQLRKALEPVQPQASARKQLGEPHIFPAASREPEVVSPPPLTREEIKQAAKEGAEESFSDFLLGLLLGVFLGHTDHDN